MSRIARRLILLVGLAGTSVLGTLGPASAKVLPVESVSVSTTRPHTGKSVDVVVRFGDGFDLGDQFAWAMNEIAVFPTTRTDRDGWPVDRNDQGLPVRLRRVSKGLYRGSFTVASPGAYMVVSRSAFYANEDRLRGVVVTGDFAAPLRVPVAAAASTGARIFSTVAVAVFAGCAALAGLAVWWRGRRRGSRRSSEDGPVEERVLVGEGAPRR